jgi:hypothetical protein
LNQNQNFIEYAGETQSNPGPQAIYIVNNTFVNDAGGGAILRTSAATDTVLFMNNLFVGPMVLCPGAVSPQKVGQRSNLSFATAAASGLADASHYNYCLIASSPAIDAATQPGSVSGFDLAPAFEYAYPAPVAARPSVGALDIGAYEYNPNTQAEKTPDNLTSASLTCSPNPFHGSMSIRYSLRHPSPVNLAVFDPLGRKVWRYHCAWATAAEHGVSWMPGEKIPGIYLVSLQAGKLRLVRKATLM